MKDKKGSVAYNDIQTFDKGNKLEAIKKDPNSYYNSFINRNPDEPDPSAPNNIIKE